MQKMQFSPAICIIWLCGFGWALSHFNTSLLWAETNPSTASVEFRHTPTSVRVETRIEVQGELKLLIPDENSPEELTNIKKQVVSRLPIQVEAQIRFQERPLELPTTSTIHSGLRKYEVAAATMQVGKGAIKQELNTERRFIVVHDHAEATSLYSTGGPLLRDELELLTVPGDSGLLAKLLPEKPAAPGETWNVSNDLLARFVRLDTITESNVSLKFNRVENNVAILDLSGKLSGGIEGISSDMELTGKLNYDLKLQQCTWLALVVKENRAASQGAPGFETTSRIRLSVEASEPEADLAALTAADFKSQPDAATRLLRYISREQGFELVYEPQWRVVTDQHDLSVLRYLNRGEMVAQCNISRLPALGKGEQLTLEGFQAHLKRSLGGSFRELVEAGERLNEGGVRVLRVVIAGTTNEVPIHWVFYHLSDDRSQRASLAITMDAEQAERFGRAEETLISSFQFTSSAGNTVEKPVVEQVRKPLPSVKQ